MDTEKINLKIAELQQKENVLTEQFFGLLGRAKQVDTEIGKMQAAKNELIELLKEKKADE